MLLGHLGFAQARRERGQQSGDSDGSLAVVADRQAYVKLCVKEREGCGQLMLA